MMYKNVLAAATVLGLFSSSGSSMAFTVDQLRAVPQSFAVQQVTFWGHPFPYGYNWSLARACTRYVPVETAHGTRLQRVWVCRQRWRRYSS